MPLAPYLGLGNGSADFVDLFFRVPQKRTSSSLSVLASTSVASAGCVNMHRAVDAGNFGASSLKNTYIFYIGVALVSLTPKKKKNKKNNKEKGSVSFADSAPQVSSTDVAPISKKTYLVYKQLRWATGGRFP